MKLFVAGSFLAFVAAASPAFFRLGPIVEAWLDPVITWQAVGPDASPKFPWTRPVVERTVTEEGVQLDVLFRTASRKDRPCKIDYVSWIWRYETVSEVAEVDYDDTDKDFRWRTTVVTGFTVSRPLKVTIPDAAYSYETARLQGMFYYRCHALWLSGPFIIDVEIAIPPDARTDPTKMPVVKGPDPDKLAMERPIVVARAGD